MDWEYKTLFPPLKRKRKQLNISVYTLRNMIVYCCECINIYCWNGHNKKECICLWVVSCLTWALVHCWPAYFECFYQLKDNLTDWKVHQPNISYSGNNDHHNLFHNPPPKNKKALRPQLRLLKDVYWCMYI